MAVGEQQHVQGFDGTKDARRWLDRTTRAEVLFDAYDGPQMVQLQLLNDEWEGWDLMGVLLDEEGEKLNTFYAESKNHTSDSTAGMGYEEFIRNCYSALAKKRLNGDEVVIDFMFITWHPFKVKTWTKLCTKEQVKEFVEAKLGTDDDVLGGHDYDDLVGEELSNHLWLIVLCNRQIADLTMSGKWLGRIKDEQTDKTKPKAGS